MALFAHEKGIVLEGKHLYGTEITPVEGVIRSVIGKMAVDLFPDRSTLKYLHRGYGERGIGTYTLQFSKEATVNHEQFAIITRYKKLKGNDGSGDWEGVEALLVLDGKDWNIDTIEQGINNPLVPHRFFVDLPPYLERDQININDATFKPFRDFSNEFEEKMDMLGDYIQQNLVMEGK